MGERDMADDRAQDGVKGARLDEERATRLAQALRANLRRRKSQARARAIGDAREGALSGTPPESDTPRHGGG
jgi:hypothetical protein